jgi:putative chitinase
MREFIKNWQQEHGLQADGIIGKNTLLKIKEVYKIPTIEATAQVMGNLHNETGGFTVFEENLNYSAQGLVNTFKKYFPTLESTIGYARNPQKIANKVYSSRMGNGNEASGDGWKFRGRGALQTTGRTNYTLLGKHLGIDLTTQPELVATRYAFDSAIFYFDSNKLWNIASTVTDDSIRKVRKAVNGGQIGLPEASRLVKMYYSIMTK